ncbi:hypothetical protein E2562_025728, partial [Oryza meyeriana var. granulata]
MLLDVPCHAVATNRERRRLKRSGGDPSSGNIDDYDLPRSMTHSNDDFGNRMMGDTLLSKLIQGDENERICVRVSRFWEFHDQRDETTVLHLGLVLIDEK